MTKRELTDEEIVRFLRFSVVESGVATFTQQAFDTQLSIERGVIWLIHAIDWQMLPNGRVGGDPAASGYEVMSAQITRETQTGIIQISDPDCIDRFSDVVERSAAVGTDAGPMLYQRQWPLQHQFLIPVPFAAQQIYVGVVTTFTAVGTIHGRIHYTIKDVPEAYFYRVAHALIG